MGWHVAGKTGTAHKLENGGYAAHKYIASFDGFAPASGPRLVIAVMIDEPAEGTVTAGNSSGLNDGAAAVLLMSAEKANVLGYKPIACLVASAAAGVPPRIMGLGPAVRYEKLSSGLN